MTLNVTSTANHGEDLVTTQAVYNPVSQLDSITEVNEESQIYTYNFDPEDTARLIMESNAMMERNSLIGNHDRDILSKEVDVDGDSTTYFNEDLASSISMEESAEEEASPLP